MRIAVQSSPETVAREAARLIASAVAHTPSLVLALPTGHTPLPLYRELVALQAAGKCNLGGIRIFNLDEFVGLGAKHPASYHAFLRRHLFEPAGIRASQLCSIRGDARDPQAEAARYERAIAKCGGIDIAVLGIGGNGHIGFNEPARKLHARTHVVTLKPATRRANAWLFDNRLSTVPRQAISMGIASILNARGLLLLATGAAKAAIVARALSGPVTTVVPASLVQTHPDAIVLLDRPAASRLKMRRV
jgi:glucosamine-6-phosphate deaminase